VSALAAVAAAPAAAGGAAAEGGEEEAAASTVTVQLTNAGQQKVQLIKKVKEITGKGLKECKELVDDLPATIKEGIDEDEAQSIREQLEEYGAEVDIS
jgi:large subunit ribosomal protein L7/L12